MYCVMEIIHCSAACVGVGVSYPGMADMLGGNSVAKYGEGEYGVDMHADAVATGHYGVNMFGDVQQGARSDSPAQQPLAVQINDWGWLDAFGSE